MGIWCFLLLLPSPAHTACFTIGRLLTHSTLESHLFTGTPKGAGKVCVQVVGEVTFLV